MTLKERMCVNSPKAEAWHKRHEANPIPCEHLRPVIEAMEREGVILDGSEGQLKCFLCNEGWPS